MFILLNNLTFHYKQDGLAFGETLVFVNSLGCDLRIWDNVVLALTSKYRIIRYDKRGHGLSDAPTGPYTIRNHSTDLEQLLDALGVETATFVGISIGGLIALDFANQHPGRVHALVLCDTAPQIGLPEFWQARMMAVEQQGLTNLAETIISRWFTSTFVQKRAAEYRGYINLLSRASQSGYMATCAALATADLRESVRGVNTPTLVICGAQDVVVSPEQSREWVASMPNARLEIIENAAHLPCIEQPEALSKLIAQFLSGRDNIPEDDKYTIGMQIRRSVLGEEHVDRTEANQTEFDADFQRFITETAWGDVWARPGLERKTRHLLTLAMLAVLGKEKELALHIRATRNTSVTSEELREVFLQVAVYAGVPAANTAFTIAKQVYAEFEEE
jgi:3-oxoadipate enol-lactonase / 4-carboxymuconolactone decarboxylase